jgi:hypothetical protein
MDLQFTLRMMGVPLDGKAYIFGDNQSLMTSGTIPHSAINKRHNALAYHCVCEASIASDVICFFHISGKINPANVLITSWDMSLLATYQTLPFLAWTACTSLDPFPFFAWATHTCTM